MIAEIVTCLDYTAQNELAAIGAGINANLETVDLNVQANKEALKDFDVKTKASIGNDDIQVIVCPPFF